MSQAKPLSRESQQNNIALEDAIATLANASRSELLEVIKQIPPEKRQGMAIALMTESSLEEKVKIFKQVPLETTGEIARAIAQVWQESD